MAQRDRLAGELRHATLQQHLEAGGLLGAGCPIAKRLHHAYFCRLLSGARQPCGLAALLREGILQGMNVLPAVVLRRAGALACWQSVHAFEYSLSEERG